MSLADLLQASDLNEEAEEKKKQSKKQAKVKQKTSVENEGSKEGSNEEPPKKKEKNGSDKKYTYPFILWMDRKQADITGIFEDGKEYTENEISKLMLEHGDYDFAGKVNYDYLKEENVLAVSFQKHSKG